MSDEGDEKTRPVILLRREADSWQAGLPFLLPGWKSKLGDIPSVVADGRAEAANRTDGDPRLKVAEETKLERDDLLALIEANDGPRGLDLSRCDMLGIDLSRETIQGERASYLDRNGAEPPWYSEVTQGAYLSSAQLQGADLREAQLQGADLSWAQLQQAKFLDAQLQEAFLWDAQLHRASLMYAQLQGANLFGAKLRGAYLSSAQLQGVDLYGVESLAGVAWHNAFLDRTRMRRDQLGDTIGDELQAHKYRAGRLFHHQASEAYLILKNNFDSIGRYEDAAWAYIKEQQMEKMAHYWEWRLHGWRVWRAWGSFWRWLRNWAYELLTGYGERPFLPVLWGLVVILAFAGGYAITGDIAPDFAGDPATAQGSHGFIDALTHSIGAFATIGFNTLEPLGWGARLLTAIESAFGIGLFALFVFTLGNRMSRS